MMEIPMISLSGVKRSFLALQWHIWPQLTGQWGDFKTYLRFHVDYGKITKMAVGQVEY
jgi:hypothetical protein